jgi:rod shape-determining protein MreD
VTAATGQLALRLLLLAFVVVLLQTAALTQVSFLGATPDIGPLVVVSAGLLTGPVGGALTGFGLGLLTDVALLQTLGVTSLVYVVVGHFAGRFRETVRDPQATLLPLAAGAIGTLVALTMFSLMQFLLGVEAPVSLELVRQIISTVLINTLFALPVHALVRRALGTAAGDARGPRRRRGRPGLSPLIQP